MHKHHIKGAGQARTDIDKPCKDPSIQQSGQELLQNTLTKHHIQPGSKWNIYRPAGLYEDFSSI
jgi:hypothetical protein